jgi:hypothetical protein
VDSVCLLLSNSRAQTFIALKINLHRTRSGEWHSGQIGTDGGETSLDNLVLLCRHHHRLVHEGGFGCEKSKTGQLVFKDERGAVIGISGTVPRLNENKNEQRRTRNRLEELHIDAMTCVTRWDGTRMNYGYVTELLACRDFPEDGEYVTAETSRPSESAVLPD